MPLFPPTVIWRHRKENLKKCSLSGLENRTDLAFYTYPIDDLPDLSGYTMLTLNPQAPSLSSKDSSHGLFLIDGTWKYADKMIRQLSPATGMVLRNLPTTYCTAYPRRQDDCTDPNQGLASVEALYIAYQILGRNLEGLLDHYHWKEKFLQINHLC